MSKRSTDYIPTASEIQAELDEAKARAAASPDPRHEYEASYMVKEVRLTERVFAYDIKDAEDHVKQQLGVVGWQPVGLQLKAIEDTNVDIAK